MVVMTCPWCEDATPVELAATLAHEYSCGSCGTSTLLADEEEEELLLAA